MAIMRMDTDIISNLCNISVEIFHSVVILMK